MEFASLVQHYWHGLGALLGMSSIPFTNVEEGECNFMTNFRLEGSMDTLHRSLNQ